MVICKSNDAVKISKISGCRDLTLLQCVSHYPASFEDVNLKVLNTYRDRYRCKVGWSDHTVNEKVLLRAKDKWEADFIEFHIDLDGNGEEYSAGHCWLPDKILSVIKSSNSKDINAEEAHILDGDGIKNPCLAEQKERNWRADPDDGLRPLKKIRDNLTQYL